MDSMALHVVLDNACYFLIKRPEDLIEHLDDGHIKSAMLVALTCVINQRLGRDFIRKRLSGSNRRSKLLRHQLVATVAPEASAFRGGGGRDGGVGRAGGVGGVGRVGGVAVRGVGVAPRWRDSG
jgi:hypothetical protein